MVKKIIRAKQLKEKMIREEKAERAEERELTIEEKRKKRAEEERKEEIATWKPKTKLGVQVKADKIKNIDEIFDKGMRIAEPEIVDQLLVLESDLIAIGQAKGKFGGGKRRAWKQTQKKTAEGNIPKFTCMAVVGDKAGHLGLGVGKAQETLPARDKALRNAKLNLVRIECGCGSFDCACGEKHSIPFKVKGKCGSASIVLMPAPKGTGLVIENECKKILALAGIKDVYSKTTGQTRTKTNLAKACFYALQKTSKIV